MLKDLVQRVVTDPQFAKAFAAAPNSHLPAFGLTQAEDEALRDWDVAQLLQSITFAEFQAFEAALGRGSTGFLFYPGFATLQVTNVRVVGSSAVLRLDVDFTWNHLGVPSQGGLPAWMRVAVFDPNEAELQPDEACQVPRLLNLKKQEGQIRRPFTAATTGQHFLALEVTHPELLNSPKFGFVI